MAETTEYKSPTPSGLDFTGCHNYITNRLYDLLSNKPQQDNSYKKRVDDLEMDLCVYRSLLSKIIGEGNWLRQGVELNHQANAKNHQNNPNEQASIVYCVIDGDGNIFADELFAKGKEGGKEAARLLEREITNHISNHISNHNVPFSIWLHIYFNRNGLKNTLRKCKVCSSEQFEDFCLGISQASPRFALIDAGQGKEAADIKIKEFLQTYTRFPQTLRVFFGGIHDNGYHPIFTELQNENLLEKVVFLKGYDELSSPQSSSSVSPIVPDLDSEITFPPLHRPDMDGFVPVLRKSREHVSRPKSQPPCNDYHLKEGGCSKPKCPYSHDPIDDNQKADLVRMVKSVPCKKVAENDSCYDRKCIYGHTCPNYTECWYLRQEKCRFPPWAHLPDESNSSYATTPISTKLSLQENESETEDNISNISITFT